MNRPVTFTSGVLIGMVITLASFGTAGVVPDESPYRAGDFTVIKPVDYKLENPLALADAPNIPTARVSWADTYPAEYKNADINTIIDPWGMYNRQCTSYAAWIVQSEYGYHIDRWYHAKFWDNQAYDRGIKYDKNPTIGSVAVSEEGQYGHVGIVRGASSAGVTVSEYNGAVPGGYAVTTYPNGFFSNFIHFGGR